ncbi:MAG TPA: carbohydrate kinase [Candidatus Limnocylindrales bacterium]
MTGDPSPRRGALITCLGEALVDFLPVEADGAVTFRPHPGGSPLNVAVAAARLGARVALAGSLGDDLFGRFLRSRVAAEGVDDRWLGSVEAPTALAFVTLEDGEPAFAFYGEGTADTLLAVDGLPEAMVEETAILHIGSISLLRGSTPDAVEAAWRRLRGRALLSLDPNVRPSLIVDEAAYLARLERLVATADLLKVSAADLAWLAPDRDVEAAALDLLARGPRLVAVTRGGDGAVAVREVEGRPVAIVMPAFPIRVADTVGAGDAFSAGLLTRLAELGATSGDALAALPEAQLRDAIRVALAAAALSCERPGADPPDRARLDSFLAARAGAARATLSPNAVSDDEAGDLARAGGPPAPKGVP